MRPENDETRLTHARVLEVFDYDQETGHFTYAIDYRRYAAGTRAGYGHGAGYIRLSLDGVCVLAHRLAFFYMRGYWPKSTIDHDNHIRTDNAWSNLKEASYAYQNTHRRPFLPRNLTAGVRPVKRKGGVIHWEARFKTKNLGTFKSWAAARAAYATARGDYDHDLSKRRTRQHQSRRDSAYYAGA